MLNGPLVKTFIRYYHAQMKFEQWDIEKEKYSFPALMNQNWSESHPNSRNKT